MSKKVQLKDSSGNIYPKTRDVYSTSEVKTDKIWIDGKHIYRKVFTYTNIGISKDVTLQATIANDINSISVIRFDFYFKLGGNDELRPFPTLASNGTALLQARWNNNKILFTGTDSWGAQTNRTLIAIIEYTKTTD